MQLFNDDCLKILPRISDKSIDLILTDPPYGTTACKWDSIIPFKPMWKELKKIIKYNGVIVLFGSEPFSSLLRCSNIKDYKYDWVWEKEQGTNQNLCKVTPLKKHENILVFKNNNFLDFANYIKSKRILLGFSKKDIDLKMGLNTAYSWWEGRKSGIQLPSNEQYILLKNILKLDNSFDELIFKKRYIPQMTVAKPYTVKRNGKTEYDPINNTNQKKIDTINKGERYPTSILKFSRELKNRFHPTQKPIALLEYLIKTYTNENDTVLDFTMGSGSTGVACKNINRNFIGIEKDQEYFNIAKDRIESTLF